MAKVNKDDLVKICIDHIKWLNNESDGKRANLQDANLWGADLRGADLRRANLQDANLWGADLRGADLRGADLRGANLWDADLQGADLQGADLRGADLQGADLRGADLRGADLRCADLRRANLQDADLDFSCLPLWCGGSKFKADSKIILQILAHVSTITASDADEELASILASIKIVAKKSHRASDLGLLE